VLSTLLIKNRKEFQKEVLSKVELAPNRAQHIEAILFLSIQAKLAQATLK
jgi:hypothetical protein